MEILGGQGLLRDIGDLIIGGIFFFYGIIWVIKTIQPEREEESRN